MGWQRLVLYRGRLPGKPKAGGHCSQQGERVGEGRCEKQCVSGSVVVCVEREQPHTPVFFGAAAFTEDPQPTSTVIFRRISLFCFFTRVEVLSLILYTILLFYSF